MMSSEANVRIRHSDANKLVTKMSYADQKTLGMPQFMGSQFLVADPE